MNRKIRTWVIGLAPYLLVIGIWFYFAVLHAIPYWQEIGDYSWYSMSYAFTFESSATGHPATNFGASIHPGLPFGLVSWLAFRVATLGNSYGASRVMFAVKHAEAFWLCAKLMALLLNFAGIRVLQRFLGHNNAAFWLAFGCYFSVVPAVFDPGLVELSNESLTLVFVVGSYLAIHRFFILASEPVKETRASESLIAPLDAAALAVGALGAIGWSIKIYYLAPSFGFAMGAVVAFMTNSIERHAFKRSVAVAAMGFAVVSTFLIRQVMGFRTFIDWIGWNWDMLTHVERYGTGSAGLANSAVMGDALKTLYLQTHARFPLIPALIVAALLVAIATGSQSASWRRRYLPYGVAVLVGFVINLFGLLKHYAPHYALPVVATLCCMPPVIETWRGGTIAIRLAGAGIAVSAIFNVADFYALNAGKLNDAEQILQDAATIDALPLPPGKKRIWGYYSAVEPAEVRLIDGYAGSAYISDILGKVNPSDDSPATARDAATWKYVIFPKMYFHTKASITTDYRQNFDFAASNFRIAPNDEIHEFNRFFVLTRN